MFSTVRYRDREDERERYQRRTVQKIRSHIHIQGIQYIYTLDLPSSSHYPVQLIFSLCIISQNLLVIASDSTLEIKAIGVVSNCTRPIREQPHNTNLLRENIQDLK